MDMLKKRDNKITFKHNGFTIVGDDVRFEFTEFPYMLGIKSAMLNMGAVFDSGKIPNFREDKNFEIIGHIKSKKNIESVKLSRYEKIISKVNDYFLKDDFRHLDFSKRKKLEQIRMNHSEIGMAGLIERIGQVGNSILTINPDSFPIGINCTYDPQTESLSVSPTIQDSCVPQLRKRFKLVQRACPKAVTELGIPKAYRQFEKSMGPVLKKDITKYQDPVEQALEAYLAK